MEKLGIKEVKEMVDLVVAVVESGAEIMKDGKVGIEDLGSVMRLVPYIGPAVQDAHMIPAELKDLDSDEAAELLAHVGAKLVVDDKKAAIVIDHSLKMLKKSYELYLEGKAMKAELDALKAPVA